MAQSQDDPASQRREEKGKLQEDRSKTVIAKANPEATKAVEKASTEAQSYTAQVREGSDGKPSSRMSSPIEQVRELNRSEITVYRRGGRLVEDESDDDDEESDEGEAKKPATRDNPKKSSRDKKRRKNRRKLESKGEGRTFHPQHSDGSPRTGDDDDYDAREPHSPRRRSSTTRTK